MKKFISTYGLIVCIIALAIGTTWAAFTDKAKILGSMFSVGSADIKLLAIIGGGIDSSNLVDEKTGPEFADISSNWIEDYPLQIYNNATGDVHLASNANYTTANDPEELRQLIFVEPIEWNDANSNGVVEDGELGVSLGRKSIVKWKTEGFDLGVLSPGQVKSMIFRFSTDAISDTKQGASALFDFEFDAIGL